MTLKLSLTDEKIKERADDIKQWVIVAIYWHLPMWQALLEEFYVY